MSQFPLTEERLEELENKVGLTPEEAQELFAHIEALESRAKDAAHEAWKPIDDAPKDVEILGWDGIQRAVICWREYGRGICGWELSCPGSNAEDDGFSPTHWCHIPRPPH